MPRPRFQRDARFMLFGLSVEETSWRGAGLLAAVFIGSLLIAAVLTPPVYWLTAWWVSESGQGQWLLNKGADVYFDRLRMAAIVLSLPWLLARCRLLSWRGLGLALDRTAHRAFWLYWLGGGLLIVLLACWRGAKMTVDISGGSVVEALLAGLLLGLIEETVFRGMVLRMFYTATPRPPLALALMSAFFAYTHFKVPSSVWQHIAPGVHWETGFFVAFWTTFGIADDFDFAQFTALFLLGVLLGVITLRRGSLWPAVGLHAGIVSAMFFFRGSGLTDGWLAAAMLAIILLVVLFMQKALPASDDKPSTANSE